ncbi:radical SAM protein, partial [Yersinia pestis]
IQYQNRYKGTKKIHNALQTNGILLDDAWCLFLRENHFLVGVSIDGPKELHDRYRVTRSGKGSFDKVMAGIEQLKKHQVEFNTLTVINRI